MGFLKKIKDSAEKGADLGKQGIEKGAEVGTKAMTVQKMLQKKDMKKQKRNDLPFLFYLFQV